MARMDAPTLPRFSGRGYAARLERRGYEVIGYGGSDDPWRAATLVLAEPGSDAVVKVGIDPYGDPWPHYATWCLRQPGTFRPTVRSMRWHGRGCDRFFVATMEKLNTPLSVYKGDDAPDMSPEGVRRLRQNETTAVSVINALAGWYRMLEDNGIDYRRDGLPAASYAKLSGRLAKRFRKAGMSELASFIEALTRAFPDWMPDPQPHNWMFTESGRLVLIDPFARAARLLPETGPRLGRALRLDAVTQPLPTTSTTRASVLAGSFQ